MVWNLSFGKLISKVEQISDVFNRYYAILKKIIKLKERTKGTAT
jgi:hypothetical protein